MKRFRATFTRIRLIGGLLVLAVASGLLVGCADDDADEARERAEQRAAALEAQPEPEPPTPTRSVYYWDVAADAVFVAPADQIPPIDAPSGGEGVRAHLFTCGSCTPSEWFGYLETYSEEAKRQIQDHGAPPADTLLRRLDDDQWVSRESSAGAAIVAGMSDRCDQPVRCMP